MSGTKPYIGKYIKRIYKKINLIKHSRNTNGLSLINASKPCYLEENEDNITNNYFSLYQTIFSWTMIVLIYYILLIIFYDIDTYFKNQKSSRFTYPSYRPFTSILLPQAHSRLFNSI